MGKNKPFDLSQTLVQKQPKNLSRTASRNTLLNFNRHASFCSSDLTQSSSSIFKRRRSSTSEDIVPNKTFREIESKRLRSSVFKLKKAELCHNLDKELLRPRLQKNTNPFWDYFFSKRLQCHREEICNSLNVSRVRSVEKGDLMKKIENSKIKTKNMQMKQYYKDRLKKSILNSNKRKNAESVIKLLEM